jgi:hypothetical protein
MRILIDHAHPLFYSIVLCYHSLFLPVYNIAKPANTPPAIAPTTPGTFPTAAPVLCAGAEAEDVADEVREADEEAEVENDEEWDALEYSIVEDIVAFLEADITAV